MIYEDVENRDKLLLEDSSLIPNLINILKVEQDLKAVEILTWVLGILAGVSLKSFKYALPVNCNERLLIADEF